MELTFNGYKYYNPNIDDSKLQGAVDATNLHAGAWDQKYFDNLVKNYEYETAANYASNFIFDDPEKDANFRRSIESLRQNGRRTAAVFNKIKHDPKAVEAVMFNDAVFVDGGIDTMHGNKYVDKFVDLKRKVGSVIDNETGEVTEEATRLSVEFANKKNYGIFGWDWIAKDNAYNIEAFYEKSGLSEQQLKAAGINVELTKDGGTILNFDKSNSLANKILSNLFVDTANMPYGTYGLGYSDRPAGSSPLIIKGYTSDNKETNVINRINTTQSLIDLQGIVQHTSQVKDKAFEKAKLDSRVYSSTITGHLDDGWVRLQQDLASGKITEAQYNTQLNTNQKEIANMLASLGSGNIEMYSNYGNSEWTDETLREADDITRAELVNLISANKGDIQVQGMISNGRTGVLVSIPALQVANKNISKNTSAEDRVQAPRIQMFIPDVLTNKVNASINRDTSSRAAKEINQMQDYEYTYTTRDGKEITPLGNGTFMITGYNELQSLATATKLINRDFMLSDAEQGLKYNYINRNNEGFNQEGYEKMASQLAYAAVNELYENTPFTDIDGSTLDIDTIMKLKGVGATMVPGADRLMSYQLYNKIIDMYSIYDYLMSQMSFYYK